jgi:type I restriction and modification enzyme subunit R-like protein
MVASERLYCQIRQEWIAATPEEKVRQELLYAMIHYLGYPSSGIVLEKSLKQMPHLALSPRKLPTRRADIVFFGKEIHPDHSLYPLLLIECKAVALNDKVFNQALGYNHYLGAYFIAIANQHTIKTAWFDQSAGEYRCVDSLPNYDQLMVQARKGFDQ